MKSEKKYCVYEHVFPNGKKYIGVTSACKRRWRAEGLGYKTQPKIARAIEFYGWDNIQHNVIFDDLTKDQALRMEEYLIAELHTIENGYNTAKGGNDVKGFYLNTMVTDMIRQMKMFSGCLKIKHPDGIKWTHELAYEDRYNKDAAEFWNEAERAVTMKHGVFSQYDEVEVARFWHCMTQYCLLYIDMQQGKDVSEWHEKEYERTVYDYFFKDSECPKQTFPEQLKLF